MSSSYNERTMSASPKKRITCKHLDIAREFWKDPKSMREKPKSKPKALKTLPTTNQDAMETDNVNIILNTNDGSDTKTTATKVEKLARKGQAICKKPNVSSRSKKIAKTVAITVEPKVIVVYFPNTLKESKCRAKTKSVVKKQIKKRMPRLTKQMKASTKAKQLKNKEIEE